MPGAAVAVAPEVAECPAAEAAKAPATTPARACARPHVREAARAGASRRASEGRRDTGTSVTPRRRGGAPKRPTLDRSPDHVCYVHSEIDSEMMQRFVDWLRRAGERGARRIHLCINSRGGSVPVTLGCVSLLQTLPVELVTYNMGHCDSAAVLLFLAGDRRVCLPRSTFFLHALRVELSGAHTLKTLGAEMRSLEADTRGVVDLLNSRTKLSRSQVEAMMSDTGTVMDARRSLACGVSTRLQKIGFRAKAGFCAI